METNTPLKIDDPTRSMLFSILVFLLCWGMGSCGGAYIKFSTPDVPLAPCPIQELLLDVSVLPGEDWKETGSRSERAATVRMGIERIGTGFSRSNGGVFQEAYRFETENRARSAYKNTVESLFTSSEYRTEWITPQELENLAVNADQYRTGCNDRKLGGLEECQYVSQYGPYLIMFFADMRGLSYENLIEFVKGIDQRTTNCIKE